MCIKTISKYIFSIQFIRTWKKLLFSFLAGWGLFMLFFVCFLPLTINLDLVDELLSISLGIGEILLAVVGVLFSQYFSSGRVTESQKKLFEVLISMTLISIILGFLNGLFAFLILSNTTTKILISILPYSFLSIIYSSLSSSSMVIIYLLRRR